MARFDIWLMCACHSLCRPSISRETIYPGMQLLLPLSPRSNSLAAYRSLEVDVWRSALMVVCVQVMQATPAAVAQPGTGVIWSSDVLLPQASEIVLPTWVRSAVMFTPPYMHYRRHHDTAHPCLLSITTRLCCYRTTTIIVGAQEFERLLYG